MALTPQEYKELQEALVDAFDYARLERVVAFGPGKKLGDITGPGPLTKVVFELIGYADANGLVPALVEQARIENPGNTRLRDVVAKYPHLVGEGPAPVPTAAQNRQVPFSRVTLIELLTRLPVTDDPQGRGSLLQGVPGFQAFNRNSGNRQLDLTLIVDQVAGLGPLSSGVDPLVTLIDNALPFAAEGTQTHVGLQAMRESLRASPPGD